MSIRIFIAIIVVQFSAQAQAFFEAPKVGEQTAASIRETIDDLIEEDAPGYAVGIVIDDEIVFSHYSGLALLDTPTSIDQRTHFNIASVAKQFTALMVLELAHSGRIDLSHDFRTYLPDALPKIEQKISIAQLITHTSGIRDVYDLFSLTGETWYEYDFSNRTARSLLDQQTALNFDPGTLHLYSNSNYILLADLVAAVVEQPFHEYANAFFADRGMEDTIVRRRYGVVIPRLARAYGKWSSGWVENADIANTHGDGFVFSTLEDQLHWETQVWGNEPTMPADIIGNSQRPINEFAQHGYGYGLEFGYYRGLQTVFHEGATGSYNSYTLRFPDTQVSIITMGNTNQVNAVSLALQVANIFLADVFTDEGPYPDGSQARDETVQINDHLGLYEFEDGTFVKLVFKDGSLYREIEGRDPVRLIHEGANLYHYETAPSLKLVLSATPVGQKLTLYSANQAPQYASWVVPVVDDIHYKKSATGAYINIETDTEIILEYVADHQFTMIKNGRARTLRLMGKDYLVWNTYRIRVLRNEIGEAIGLLVDRNRIRNVIFSKVK